MKERPKGIPHHNVLDLRSQESEREESVEKKEVNTKENLSVSFLQRFHVPKSPKQEKEITSSQEKKVEPPKIVTEKKEKVIKKEKRKDNSPSAFSQFITQRISYGTLGIFIVLLLFVAAIFGSIDLYSKAKETKGQVLGTTTSAFASLEEVESALLNNDFENAILLLEEAEKGFDDAISEVKQVYSSYGFLLFLSGSKSEVEAGEYALRAGRSIARVGLLLSDFVEDAESDGAVGYIGFMEAYQTYDAPLRHELEQTITYLNAIDIEKLPEEYQGMFLDSKEKFYVLFDAFDRADVMLAIFSDVLGFRGEKTHLLLFQNNQELRATGGFIGSVARINVKEGHIDSLIVPKGGSYDISGQVKARYKAPRPLQIVNPYLSFQDANWFANFEESASKVLDLYYDAGNKPVDGVIAFTPDVILNLLDITGPIELTETVSVSVTSENFLRVTRDAIEGEKEEKSHEPKKIIAELMPELLNQALSLPLEDQLSVAFLLENALQQKDILLYSTDESLQQEIEVADFAGNLMSPANFNDYLAIISSNIAGGKTDRDIEQHINISTDLTALNPVNTIRVTRTHNGIPSDPYSGTTNLSYVRFYTSFGSSFLSANYFYDVPYTWFQEPPNNTPTDAELAQEELQTIVQEATQTRILDSDQWSIFGNWIRVEPQESVQVDISYELPPTRIDNSWSMYFEKQPGGHKTFITWTVTANTQNTNPQISVPAHVEQHGNETSFSFELTEDVIAGITF